MMKSTRVTILLLLSTLAVFLFYNKCHSSISKFKGKEKHLFFFNKYSFLSKFINTPVEKNKSPSPTSTKLQSNIKTVKDDLFSIKGKLYANKKKKEFDETNKQIRIKRNDSNAYTDPSITTSIITSTTAGTTTSATKSPDSQTTDLESGADNSNLDTTTKDITAKNKQRFNECYDNGRLVNFDTCNAFTIFGEFCDESIDNKPIHTPLCKTDYYKQVEYKKCLVDNVWQACVPKDVNHTVVQSGDTIHLKLLNETLSIRSSIIITSSDCLDPSKKQSQYFTFEMSNGFFPWGESIIDKGRVLGIEFKDIHVSENAEGMFNVCTCGSESKESEEFDYANVCKEISKYFNAVGTIRVIKKKGNDIKKRSGELFKLNLNTFPVDFPVIKYFIMPTIKGYTCNTINEASFGTIGQIFYLQKNVRNNLDIFLYEFNMQHYNWRKEDVEILIEVPGIYFLCFTANDGITQFSADLLKISIYGYDLHKRNSLYWEKDHKNSLDLKKSIILHRWYSNETINEVYIKQKGSESGACTGKTLGYSDTIEESSSEGNEDMVTEQIKNITIKDKDIVNSFLEICAYKNNEYMLIGYAKLKPYIGHIYSDILNKNSYGNEKQIVGTNNTDKMWWVDEETHEVFTTWKYAKASEIPEDVEAYVFRNDNPQNAFMQQNIPLTDKLGNSNSQKFNKVPDDVKTYVLNGKSFLFHHFKDLNAIFLKENLKQMYISILSYSTENEILLLYSHNNNLTPVFFKSFKISDPTSSVLHITEEGIFLFVLKKHSQSLHMYDVTPYAVKKKSFKVYYALESYRIDGKYKTVEKPKVNTSYHTDNENYDEETYYEDNETDDDENKEDENKEKDDNDDDDDENKKDENKEDDDNDDDENKEDENKENYDNDNDNDNDDDENKEDDDNDNDDDENKEDEEDGEDKKEGTERNKKGKDDDNDNDDNDEDGILLDLDTQDVEEKNEETENSNSDESDEMQKWFTNLEKLAEENIAPVVDKGTRLSDKDIDGASHVDVDLFLKYYMDFANHVKCEWCEDVIMMSPINEEDGELSFFFLITSNPSKKFVIVNVNFMLIYVHNTKVKPTKYKSEDYKMTNLDSDGLLQELSFGITDVKCEVMKNQIVYCFLVDNFSNSVFAVVYDANENKIVLKDVVKGADMEDVETIKSKSFYNFAFNYSNSYFYKPKNVAIFSQESMCYLLVSEEESNDLHLLSYQRDAMETRFTYITEINSADIYTGNLQNIFTFYDFETFLNRNLILLITVYEGNTYFLYIPLRSLGNPVELKYEYPKIVEYKENVIEIKPQMYIPDVLAPLYNFSVNCHNTEKAQNVGINPNTGTVVIDVTKFIMDPIHLTVWLDLFFYELETEIQFVVICSDGMQTENGNCTPCPKGTYNNTKEHEHIGQPTKCTPCHPHSTTKEEKSVSIADCLCEPGFEFTEGACTPCKKGTWKSELANIPCFHQCYLHSTSEKEGSTTEEESKCSCHKGFYFLSNNGKNSCEECEHGYYCPGGYKEKKYKCQENMTTATRQNAVIESCKCQHGYEPLIQKNKLDSVNNTNNHSGSSTSSSLSTEVNTQLLDTNSKAIVCVPCPIGFYKSTISNEPCTPCGNNVLTKNQQSTLRSECSICLKGHFAVAENNCEVCPDNHYCPGGSVSDSKYADLANQKVPCGANKATKKPNELNISPMNCLCKEGYEYQKIDDYEFDCVEVPKAFYKEGLNNDAKKPCLSGSTTEQTGTTTMDRCLCPVGHYFDNIKKECAKCPEGYYCPGGFIKNCIETEQQNVGATCSAQKIKCPIPHSTTQHMESSSDASCFCEKGYTVNKRKTNECIPCPPDTFKDVVSNVECTKCPTLYTTDGQTGSTLEEDCTCSGGYYYFKHCIPCPHGNNYCKGGKMIVNNNTTVIHHAPSKCPPNTKVAFEEQYPRNRSFCICKKGFKHVYTAPHDKMIVICAPCDPGRFKTVVGNFACDSKCKPNATSFVGISHESYCFCVENYYYKNGLCVKCPDGALCKGGLEEETVALMKSDPHNIDPSQIKHVIPVPKNDYSLYTLKSSTHKASWTIIPCPIKGSCLFNGVCYKSMTSFLCAECENGYSNNFSKLHICSKCGNKSFSVLYILFFATVVLVCTIVMAYLNVFTGANRKTIHSIVLKIAFNYFSCMRVFITLGIGQINFLSKFSSHFNYVLDKIRRIGNGKKNYGYYCFLRQQFNISHADAYFYGMLSYFISPIVLALTFTCLMFLVVHIYTYRHRGSIQRKLQLLEQIKWSTVEAVQDGSAKKKSKRNGDEEESNEEDEEEETEEAEDDDNTSDNVEEGEEEEEKEEEEENSERKKEIEINQEKQQLEERKEMNEKFYNDVLRDLSSERALVLFRYIPIPGESSLTRIIHFLEDMTPIYVTLFFLIHTRTTFYMLSLLDCKSIYYNEKLVAQYMRYASSVKCDVMAEYRRYYVLGIAGLLLWGLGIPFMSFFVLFKNRNILHTPDIQFKYGFLNNGFHFQYWYWETVVFLRKILVLFIVTVRVFKTQNIYKIGMWSFTVISVFSLLIQITLHPFDSRNYHILNKLETLSMFSLTFTLIIFVILAEGNFSVFVNFYIFMFIVIVNCIFIGKIIVALCSSYLESIRHNKLMMNLPCIGHLFKRLARFATERYHKEPVIFLNIYDDNSVQFVRKYKKIMVSKNKALTRKERSYFIEVLTNFTYYGVLNLNFFYFHSYFMEFVLRAAFVYSDMNETTNKNEGILKLLTNDVNKIRQWAKDKEKTELQRIHLFEKHNMLLNVFTKNASILRSCQMGGYSTSKSSYSNNIKSSKQSYNIVSYDSRQTYSSKLPFALPIKYLSKCTSKNMSKRFSQKNAIPLPNCDIVANYEALIEVLKSDEEFMNELKFLYDEETVQKGLILSDYYLSLAKIKMKDEELITQLFSTFVAKKNISNLKKDINLQRKIEGVKKLHEKLIQITQKKNTLRSDLEEAAKAMETAQKVATLKADLAQLNNELNDMLSEIMLLKKSIKDIDFQQEFLDQQEKENSDDSETLQRNQQSTDFANFLIDMGFNPLEESERRHSSKETEAEDHY